MAGMEQRLSHALDIPFHLYGGHGLSTIRGLREMIRHPELLHWSYVPVRQKY